VGFVENSAPYLKKLDYLLFTSKHEGLPMTLLESMALETVVISTNLPTIKSVLNGDECGFFPESEVPEAMATSINQLVKDNSLKQKKAKAAKDILNRDYSLKTNIKKYLAVYQQLLD
jgi:glycosyltransferase involved in cell wall biosynthesis